MAVGACLLAAGQGCLSQSYEVSSAELARIARLPDEARGERIQVVQQTTFGSDIDEEEQERLASGDPLYLYMPLHDHDHHHHHHDKDDDDDDDPSPGSAAAAVAVAVAVGVVAATAAVSLAAIEGARYDGWVRVDGGQPLLLIDERGNRRWVALAELEPSDLESVTRGVLPEVYEGFEYLGRRPLDRRGMMYQFELGSAQVASSADAAAWGFAGRVALGYMPTRQFGLSVGWAPSVLKAPGGDLDVTSEELTFESRLFMQAEYWPLAFRRLHAGLYAELGYGWVLRDEALGSRGTSGSVVGAGVALQIDWTTRLALTLRSGLAFVPHLEAGFGAAAESRRIAPAITLGVGIY